MRWTRILATVMAVGLMVGLAGTGSAASGRERGGWAATIMDPVGEFKVGEPQQVRFWVLQHGYHSYWSGSMGTEKLEKIGLQFTGPGGEIRFDARRLPETAHYEATVTLPTAGHYTVEGVQGIFGLYDVGTLDAPGSLKLIQREAPDKTTTADYLKAWGTVHPPYFVTTPDPLKLEEPVAPAPTAAAPVPAREDDSLSPAVIWSSSIAALALIAAGTFFLLRRRAASTPRRELVG